MKDSRARFPFPTVPNGWFPVAWSHELEAGAVAPLRYFGRDLVLFRTESGRAHVLDAYCPHLGTHLGHGGAVVGETIRCPFHAWRFDGDGACVEVPYAKKVPAKARLDGWTLDERNGQILVWHHAEGKPPSFEIPRVPEHEDPAWTPYEYHRWKVRTHNQEMAENAVDAPHFRYVHGTPRQPATHAEAKGPVLHVQSEVIAGETDGKTVGTIESISYGFGVSTVRFQGVVETLLVSGTTPDGDGCVDVRFAFKVKKLPTEQATRSIANVFIKELAGQLEQDIPIWENKIHIDPPVLCDGDGPIGIFRRWARQFYSEAA